MANHKSSLLETGGAVRGRIAQILERKETIVRHETNVVAFDLVLPIADEFQRRVFNGRN